MGRRFDFMRLIGPLVLILIAVLALAWIGLRTGSPKGRISVDDASFEFGSLGEMETTQHRFVLRNEGKSAVEIEKIFPGCGCAIVEEPRGPIEAGAEIELPLEVHGQGLSGPLSKAIVVTFRADDEGWVHPPLQLWINGIVEEDLIVQPPRVQLGDLKRDDEHRFIVEVKAPRRPIKALTVETGSERLSHQVHRRDDRSFRVELTLKTPNGAGPWNGVVVFGDGKSRVQLVVAARIR